MGIMAGCGNEEAPAEMNHDHASEDEVRSLEVDLEVPETAGTGETLEFTAHVHSNGEDVQDADSVMFEVLEGEESLEMIEAEHDENGNYTIEHTFDEAGTYTVISHVDAFQLHTMPQKEITVE
ncbi:FixH family protein [Salinicoccus sp. ID82-1]|uniref:FixH family protein n=2 Tax=Staphylococcaceae TaxID=90964 RepID=A0A558ARD6_9STAP|nr:FixH family protein [Salinicoccus sp. ID82-1]MCG1010192.1 FixH family protein [Salinicoccus sp. ID82-1]TVT26812.1 FixH family protein [Salinicoccus cyprini]